MNALKRVLNVLFAWFVVFWAPVMAMTFCLVCVAYKLFEGKYPDKCEKSFKMLCLGENGLFDVSKQPEAEPTPEAE